MDRIEPTTGADLQGVTFRRPPRWTEPATDSRFALGVAIFLLVALAYPWYSYRVQAYLMARDMRAGFEAFTGAMNRESDAVQAQAQLQVAQADRESAEVAQRRRLAQVRVSGISTGDPPLVVVQLGTSNLSEADALICRQAEPWLKRELSGRVIRVQGIHASGRTGTIQKVVCP
jgi:hypothetical protein